MKSATSLSLFLVFLSRVQSDVVLTQPEAETARPGGSLKLSCQTSGFDLSSYYMHLVRLVPGQGLEWLLTYYSSSYQYYAQGIQSRFTPSKDTLSSVFSVDVTKLKTQDTAVYYCAKYHAASSAPSLYPLLSCEQHSPADSVTFGCLATDYSPKDISVSWRKDKVPITTGLKDYPAVLNKKGTYTSSSQLTITESEAGSSAIYCVVRYRDTVKEVKMPDMEVHHPIVVIAVNSLDEIKRSREVTAVCSITDFRPAQLTVTWLKNGQPLNSVIATSPAFEVNGNFSATSQVTFSAAEWFAGSVYTCQVTHKKDTQSRNISISQDPNSCEEEQITIQPPPLEQVLMEATVTLTCVISYAPYGVQVTWNEGEKQLKSDVTYQHGESFDSVISTLNISTQAWLSGAEFECVVSHEEMPTPKRASIHKEEVAHPREPSLFVLLPPAEGVSAQKSVALTCLVRGFSPRRIFVKWTVDDKPVDSRNYRNTKAVAENGNSSYFMYSLLSVGAEHWASGASFSCVVGHETLPMKTIARTVNRSSDFADNIRIEVYEEDRDNIWTTASAFIILFFLSISYGAAITLVKVK